MLHLLYFLGCFYLAALPLPEGMDHHQSPVRAQSKWVVLSSSSLSIGGHSNVCRFTCGVPRYAEPDTLTFLETGSRGQVPGVPLAGTLTLNVSDFDCHNRIMTGEFQSTLSHGKYPHLKIEFVNLEKMPSFQASPEAVKGWVVIELAGTSRAFEVSYTASRCDSCAVELTGVRTLGFHDFSLEPPKKMGGLVRVSDTIDVQFSLCLRKID